MEAGGNGNLFGQAVQDRNEGGKLSVKSGAARSQGGGWEGGLVHIWLRGQIQETVKNWSGV